MRALALVAALALAGCATAPRTPARAPADVPDRAEADARQAAHEARVGLAGGDCAQPAWTLAGRVGVSNGRDGGSGRIDWSQGEGRYAIALSAPVTRQSWRLSGGDGEARLEGLDGGPRTGADATALLAAATGWTVPVAALGCWVRGARADAARFGPAQLRWDSEGRLAGLVQDGWTIEFTAWTTVADTALPARLTAARGDARVRLVVDRWGAAAP